MIDKEKVIKGLECCSQTATLEKPFICKECPYFSEGGPCNRIQFARDALALLKEQEEAIPISWLESYTRLKCMDYVHDLMLDLIKTWKLVKWE